MANDIQPRGFRNNNPLNIRKGSNWKGLSPVQSDKSFCVFISMRYGIRAAIYLLLKYYTKYKLHTLYAIISRWAPQNENNTIAYCRSVALRLHIPLKHTDSIDLDLPHNYDLFFELFCAMVFVENGRHLDLNRNEFYDILNNDIPSTLK